MTPVTSKILPLRVLIAIMNKAMARNVFLTFGIWSVAQLVIWLLSFVLPLRGLTFRGELGTVLLWIWLGLPHLLAAAIVANTLVWITDTRRPRSWILGLSALFLYSESIRFWRQLRQSWREPLTLPDCIGMVVAAILPALGCLVIGIWWEKRLAGQVHHNSEV